MWKELQLYLLRSQRFSLDHAITMASLSGNQERANKLLVQRAQILIRITKAEAEFLRKQRP